MFFLLFWVADILLYAYNLLFDAFPIEAFSWFANLQFHGPFLASPRSKYLHAFHTNTPRQFIWLVWGVFIYLQKQ
jgi:hypothetical protein